MKKMVLGIASLICGFMILNMLFIQKNYAEEPILMSLLAILAMILTFFKTKQDKKDQ